MRGGGRGTFKRRRREFREEEGLSRGGGGTLEGLSRGGGGSYEMRRRRDFREEEEGLLRRGGGGTFERRRKRQFTDYENSLFLLSNSDCNINSLLL